MPTFPSLICRCKGFVHAFESSCDSVPEGMYWCRSRELRCGCCWRSRYAVLPSPRSVSRVAEPITTFTSFSLARPGRVGRRLRRRRRAGVPMAPSAADISFMQGMIMHHQSGRRDDGVAEDAEFEPRGPGDGKPHQRVAGGRDAVYEGVASGAGAAAGSRSMVGMSHSMAGMDMGGMEMKGMDMGAMPPMPGNVDGGADADAACGQGNEVRPSVFDRDDPAPYRGGDDGEGSVQYARCWRRTRDSLISPTTWITRSWRRSIL